MLSRRQGAGVAIAADIAVTIAYVSFFRKKLSGLMAAQSRRSPVNRGVLGSNHQKSLQHIDLWIIGVFLVALMVF